MKRKRVVAILLLIALGAGDSLHARKAKPITGTIVAYFVYFRMVQVASFVENHEIFLVRVEPQSAKERARLIKVVHDFFGYSELTAEQLQSLPKLRMRLKRESKCDETYGQLLSRVPGVTAEDIATGEKWTRNKIEFLDKSAEQLTSNDLPLECFLLEQTNSDVELASGAQGHHSNAQQDKCDFSSSQYQAVRTALEKRDFAQVFRLSDSHEQQFICALRDPDADTQFRVISAAPYVNSAALTDALRAWLADKDASWYKLPAASPLPDWQTDQISAALNKDLDCTSHCALDDFTQLIVPLSLSSTPKAKSALTALRTAAKQWRWKDEYVIRENFQIADSLARNHEMKAKDPIRAVKAYAPFLHPKERSRSTYREAARNRKGDRVLVRIYVDNGPLAERRYDVILHKDKDGWRYEAILLTGVS